MGDLHFPEGINEAKLREAQARLKAGNQASVTWRWSFGPKGFRSISLFKWIQEMFRKRKEG